MQRDGPEDLNFPPENLENLEAQRRLKEALRPQRDVAEDLSLEAVDLEVSPFCHAVSSPRTTRRSCFARRPRMVGVPRWILAITVKSHGFRYRA